MQVERITVLLREAKTRKKMTINEIAAKSNVGIRTVNRIFAGEDVRFSSMVAVLDVLDIDFRLHKKMAGN